MLLLVLLVVLVVSVPGTLSVDILQKLLGFKVTQTVTEPEGELQDAR